ncbi:hypothetical protein [Paenibacillus pabuli]|uniref:hypothetical protein n=1 Tax=Paenibacillus pabuli TaxID=1472 RepID=UPI0007815A1D|nr:hypothetical protein [Paenibacillus pabuli]MEC0125329.1 hypothetical protein [Paenibacillus pabuli]
MVKVNANLQEADGSFDEYSSRTYDLNEAQVTALLNSDIVTYPRSHGSNSRSSVKTRIIQKNFSLFDPEKPVWEIVFQVIE